MIVRRVIFEWTRKKTRDVIALRTLVVPTLPERWSCVESKSLSLANCVAKPKSNNFKTPFSSNPTLAKRPETARCMCDRKMLRTLDNLNSGRQQQEHDRTYQASSHGR